MAVDVSTPSPALTRTVAFRPKIKIAWVGPIVVLAVLIGAWFLLAKHYDDQGLGFLVPYPQDVWKLGFADGQSRHDLLVALWRSTQVSMTGLGIAIVIGGLWAVLMAQARWVEQSLFPYAVMLQCIPILALVPLIGALFGYEFKSRVIVTVMISLFPLVANTLFGLQATDKGQRELFQLHKANPLTRLQKLQFQAALPSIFVGLRTAAGLSVVGAIVGDQFFQRGNTGLGVLINVDQQRLLGPQMYAAIFTAAGLGIAVFLIFGLLGRLAVGRWHDFS